MKVKWTIEGIGYGHLIPDRILEIPDDELEGLEGDALDSYISAYVQDTFDQNIHPSWSHVTV